MLYKLSIFLLLLSSSCTNVSREESISHEEEDHKPSLPLESHSADTTDGTPYIVILKGSGTQKNFKLSKSDMELIDSLLNAAVDDYNEKGEKRLEEYRSKGITDIDPERILIDLRFYKRQYVPYINENGEREVWINCFCTYRADWKTRVTEVKDGGNCFFNLMINLDNKTRDLLSANGHA